MTQSACMCQISNMPPLLVSESHQINVPKSRQGPSWARGPSGHNDSLSKYQPNRLSPVRISCPHPGQWPNRFRLGPLQLSSRFCIPSSDYAGQFCYLSIHMHSSNNQKIETCHVQSSFQLFIKMLIDMIWHWQLLTLTSTLQCQDIRRVTGPFLSPAVTEKSAQICHLLRLASHARRPAWSWRTKDIEPSPPLREAESPAVYHLHVCKD